MLRVRTFLGMSMAPPKLPIVLLLTAMILGCSSTTPKPLVVEEKPAISNPDWEMWKEGIQEFEKEDYNEAMVIFEYLSEHAHNKSLAAKAVFALACTRLIVAQFPEEFEEGLRLWECWAREQPIDPEDEDPRMLTPFLERLSIPVGTEPAARKPVAKSKKRGPTKIEVANKDLAHYKNLLEEKEKESQRLKARLEARDKEVRRLRQQIESLEAIHLKFQEKKKEVSSP